MPVAILKFDGPVPRGRSLAIPLAIPKVGRWYDRNDPVPARCRGSAIDRFYDRRRRTPAHAVRGKVDLHRAALRSRVRCRWQYLFRQ